MRDFSSDSSLIFEKIFGSFFCVCWGLWHRLCLLLKNSFVGSQRQRKKFSAVYLGMTTFCWVRPHLAECTTSRPICEVKQPQARLVLRSVMTWEPRVLYPKLFSHTPKMSAAYARSDVARLQATGECRRHYF